MAVTLNFQDDMKNIFLESGFQEDIIYTPSGGVAKTIPAIVFRDGAMDSNSGSRTGKLSNSTLNRYYKIQVQVSTNPTDGVETVTIKEDKVELKQHINDSANSTFYVKGIIQDDPGAYMLGIS